MFMKQTRIDRLREGKEKLLAKENAHAHLYAPEDKDFIGPLPVVRKTSKAEKLSLYDQYDKHREKIEDSIRDYRDRFWKLTGAYANIVRKILLQG